MPKSHMWLVWLLHNLQFSFDRDVAVLAATLRWFDEWIEIVVFRSCERFAAAVPLQEYTQSELLRLQAAVIDFWQFISIRQHISKDESVQYTYKLPRFRYLCMTSTINNTFLESTRQLFKGMGWSSANLGNAGHLWRALETNSVAKWRKSLPRIRHYDKSIITDLLSRWSDHPVGIPPGSRGWLIPDV
ncbi:hypothetical protein DL96DRAFT_1569059 [Flagelloscypha sp. PMI_526]|nr:hypothetical protein DL96DRAFT_1569059 [Flagelloscypha sp. PMI_526]